MTEIMQLSVKNPLKHAHVNNTTVRVTVLPAATVYAPGLEGTLRNIDR
jgi:hypothetical protein